MPVYPIYLEDVELSLKMDAEYGVHFYLARKAMDGMDVEKAFRRDELAALRSERERIIQETIDGLPGECKRMIAESGGVMIGQYRGESDHSRFDIVWGEAFAWLFDEFCLWIGFNGRVRTFALKEILQHELAHIIPRVRLG